MQSALKKKTPNQSNTGTQTRTSMEYFLEQEKISAREVPNIQITDATFNTSSSSLGCKRLSAYSVQSASSGYCSLVLDGDDLEGASTSSDSIIASNCSKNSSDEDSCSKIIDVLNESFYSNKTLNCSAAGIELMPKTDLELFKPTQNQAFRENVIACDDIDVAENDVDELNSTLERVDFILNQMDYKPKLTENSERKRLLVEYGKNIVKAEKKKMSKRTISVDMDVKPSA